MTTPAPFQNQPAERETLQGLLKQDRYKNRFEQVLGDRAPQFISSILSLGATLHDVEPRSILASAAVAASLNLPINPTLGFAWIVPYKRNGVKYGQFQIGYKGITNLAQRTGAYASMNAEPVNAEVYKGRNKVGEPIIDWDALDETKPVAGYVFAFEMINGFAKVCYWSKEKVERHAQRYSQAYRGGYETPWKTDFDRMAIKTVVSNELRRWGMLSVELQGAFAADQTIRTDLDAPAEYPDPIDVIATPKFDGDEKAEAAAGLAPLQQQQQPPPQATATVSQPQKPARKGRADAPKQPDPQSAAGQVNVAAALAGQPAPTSPTPASPTPQPPTAPSNLPPTTSEQQPPPAAAPTEAQPQPQTAEAQPTGGDLFGAGGPSAAYTHLTGLLEARQLTQPEVVAICKRRGLMTGDQDDLVQMSDAKLTQLASGIEQLAAAIRIDRKSKGK